MDIERNLRRRGRRPRSKNYATFRDLPPGRIPVGFPGEVTAPSSTSLPTHPSCPQPANCPSPEAATGSLSAQKAHASLPSAALIIDMLGAQARAAELQAAKSAAMRQKAHREAEDLSLPPESAPVSLTDFVRNPLLNKNKGVKAFRPLTDSDFEAANIQAEIQSSKLDTPSTDSCRTELVAAAPVAPRAMLNRSDSHLSKMACSRVRAPNFTPQDQAASTFTRVPDAYDGLMSTSPYTGTTSNAAGYVFGPEDLSPLKQEVKFNQMRQQYGGFQATQTPIHHFPTPFMPDARIFTPQQNFPYDAHLQRPEVHTQPPYDPYLFPRPPLQHYQSETGTSATGYAPNQTHAERTQVFADDLMDHHQRMQQQSRAREPLKPSPLPHDSDVPYDRNSKMQSFVAAQQAMARKGRTVLHNPGVHRSPQHINFSTPNSYPSTMLTPSPFQTHQSMSMLELEQEPETPGSRKATKLEDKQAIIRALLKRNIIQTKPPSNLSAIEKENEVEAVKDFDVDEGKSFSDEIMSEDWCTLRPIKVGERETMLRNMRKFVAESSPSSEAHLVTTSTSIVGAKAQDWLRDGTMRQSARMVVLESIVDEYEKRMDHSPAYGIIGRPISREQSHLSSRGGLRAVAKIMASILNSADNDKKYPTLSQYTPTPSYAIDTDAANSSSGASLFDNLGFDPAKPQILHP